MLGNPDLAGGPAAVLLVEVAHQLIPRHETSCQNHPEIPSDSASLLLRATGFTLAGQGIRQSLRLDSLAHD